MFYKNTERCSAEMLRGNVLQNCWGELRTITQNEQFLCKNLGTWSVLGGQKITDNYWERSNLSFQVICSFLTFIKTWKRGYRSYDLWIWRNKLNDQFKNLCYAIPSPPFSLCIIIFGNILPFLTGAFIFWITP